MPADADITILEKPVFLVFSRSYQFSMQIWLDPAGAFSLLLYKILIISAKNIHSVLNGIQCNVYRNFLNSPLQIIILNPTSHAPV
jgi:hypothetical protein